MSQSTESRPSNAKSAGGADTRERLLLGALRVFADAGVSAGSTRAIQTAAGSQNASAIQYHYRDKAGLVEAVIDLVGERLGAFGTALPESTGEPVDPHLLFRALLSPYVKLFLDPEIGRDAIKFLARMQMESDPELRVVFRRKFGPQAVLVEEALRRAFPKLSPETVRMRLLFTLALVVHGFSTVERLRDSTLGEAMPPRPAQVLHQFVEYVVGAWSGPETDLAARD